MSPYRAVCKDADLGGLLARLLLFARSMATPGNGADSNSAGRFAISLQIKWPTDPKLFGYCRPLFPEIRGSN
jgi:hypothetical protein